MRKKYAFWAAILLVAFLGHGCGNPVSLNLKVKTEKFGYNFNTVLANSDITRILNATLDKVLKDGLPEGFRLYDMVNIDALTFLAAYEMDLIDSFNPNDYLKDINFELGKQPIEKTIEIPEFTPLEPFGAVYWFDMRPLLKAIKDKTTNKSPVPFPTLKIPMDDSAMSIINSALQGQPSFMDLGDGGDVDFNSVILAAGEVKITLTLDIPGTADPSAGIILEGIGLQAGGSPIGGPAQSAELSRSQPSQEIIINLMKDPTGEDLIRREIFKNYPPQLVIGGLSTTNGGSPDVADLTVKIELNDPQIRGATGLIINNDNLEKLERIIKLEGDVVRLSDYASEFINAKIGKGEVDIKVRMPDNPGHSYISGVNATYKIILEQGPISIGNFPGMDLILEGVADDNSNLPPTYLEDKHINGNKLGIKENDSYIEITPDDSRGIDFELYDDDMYYKTSLPHYEERGKLPPSDALPVLVDLDIKIEELKIVRWSTTTKNEKGEPVPIIALPDDDLLKIDFSKVNGKDISKFIQWIEFNKIEVSIDFTDHRTSPPEVGFPPELHDLLALKITSKDLGFTEDPKILTLEDGNHIISFTGAESLQLDLKDGDKPRVIDDIELNLIPVINGEPKEDAEYFEFGPLKIENMNHVLNIYGEVSVDFDWKSASIDLEGIFDIDEGINKKASYPAIKRDNDGNIIPGNGLDLQDMVGKYMSGFELFKETKDEDGADAKLYLGCPELLLEVIEPKLTIAADWEGKPDEFGNIVDPGHSLTEVDPHELFGIMASLLPSEGDDGLVISYTGTDRLPNPNGTIPADELIHAIADFPKDLYFNYVMEVIPTTPGNKVILVRRDMFNPDAWGEESDFAVKAFGLVKIPLKLKAVGKDGEDACFKIPNDSFVEKNDAGEVTGYKDLFGRTKSADNPLKPDPESDPFKDLNNIQVKEIKLSIEFDGNFFHNGRLHIDRNHVLFGEEGLPLNNGRNNKLEISFTRDDWDVIRNNIIEPEIKISFPQGSILAVPRNLVPTKISFSVKGDYLQQIDL